MIAYHCHSQTIESEPTPNYVNLSYGIPPHSHSIVLSDGNALNFQRKFFMCATKNRLTDPSENRALDFKHEFGRAAVCSVSATIANDRSIF